jgi:hypothetical protein
MRRVRARALEVLPDSETVDELYGLEPVYEPSEGDGSSPTQFVAVTCPYCGESFDTQVDLSAGAFSYIEDCQVCCQPMELAGATDDTGALIGVTASRVG